MADLDDGLSALDRVNGYEVESFLELHGAGTARAGGVIKVLLGQSSDFADASHDPNEIHRKMPGLEQAVSPGFLQTCAAIALSRDAIRNLGLNSLDYPYSLNECEMPGFVITGKQYSLEARFDGNSRQADVEIKNSNGDLVYRLQRKLFKHQPAQGMPEIRGEPVYEGVFRITGEDSIQNFGQLVRECFTTPIGLGSSESHLRALAGASSAVNAAVAEKKLNPVQEELEPFYIGKQEFYLDSRRTLDLQEGIRMKLYVADAKKFGRKSAHNAISIVGENSDGLIYHFNATLRFMKSKFLAQLIAEAI